MSRRNQLSFRNAGPADHATVVRLLGELVDELGPKETAARVKHLLDADIQAALASEAVVIILAESDGEAVGLARGDVLTTDPIFRLREDHRCGYVDQMFVRVSHRGQRVGAELLRRCEDWFRQQGIGHSLLHAAPRAVRFYAGHGYQPNREMFKRL